MPEPAKLDEVVQKIVKELETVKIIRSKVAFEQLLASLRQDWYSPDKLNYNELLKEFYTWKTLSRGAFWTFYLAIDEAEDFGKNDGWGKVTLYRAVSVGIDGQMPVILTDKIHEFAH